jgi:beta-glucosidase
MINRDRRDFVKLAGAASLVLPSIHARAESNPSSPKPRNWPQSFLWGVATAGHQIEGNNINSDYWVLENLPGTNFKDQSGDACDSWNRWQEDIALIRGLGVNAYRFSVEWSRIEPEEGMFSNAALAYYRRICEALREANIMPIVTFHHFVSPRWVAALGGWENPIVVDRFARYCEHTARALGALVGAACTMNEPNAQVTSYIMRGERPFIGEDEIVKRAAARLGADRFGAYFMGNSFKVRDGCIAAHRKAVEAIGSANPNIRIGLTLALQDIVAGENGEALQKRIFAEARQPFYEATSKDGFIGVQPYMRLRTGATGYLAPPAGVPLNQDGQEVSADAISSVIKEVNRHCKAPIMVTENGIETADDALRAAYIPKAVDAVGSSLDAGINVLGYIHWSLLDNFEWRSGYKPRFGLYAVDRKTFIRTPKPSASVYRQLVKTARAVQKS